MSSGESIQAAIDAASEGDTICVEPGTYPGNLEIDTANLTLQSTEGAESTIIDPEGAFVGVRAMSGGLGDVTVDGFTVLEDWIASGIGQGLAASEGTSLHVLNNVVMAPATTTQHGNAIQVTGDGSTVLNNSVVVPNQVSPDWRGSGILLFGASNVLIQGNTATSSPEDSCIVLGGDNFGAPAARNNTVVDNLVHDCGFGIVIEPGVHDTVVNDNKVRNSTVGVNLIEGVEDVVVLRHNHISGNDVGLRNAEGNPTADARWNYWGCPEGPDDEACDSIVGDVEYDPWLTDLDYTGSLEFDHGENLVVEATLLDSDGDGVAGIEVEFFLDNASVGMDLTNEDGVASLNLGPRDAGDYDVRAEALCGCLVAEATVTMEEEPEPDLLCPTNLRAVVDGEDIVVGFDPATGSDGTRIYRSAGDADAELVAELGSDATRFRDTDVTAGVSYTYEARAVYGELESEDCPTARQRVEPAPDPEPEPEPEPECPAVAIDAVANQDGSITVTVDTDASYDLVRLSGDERVELGSFDGDQQFLDTNTTVGQTYTYVVEEDGEDCAQVQVTAIPVFTTPVAMGLAASVGLLAYAGLRRRIT